MAAERARGGSEPLRVGEGQPHEERERIPVARRWPRRGGRYVG